MTSCAPVSLRRQSPGLICPPESTPGRIRWTVRSRRPSSVYRPPPQQQLVGTQWRRHLERRPSASCLFQAASCSSVSCRHCSDLGTAHGWPLRGRPLPTMPRSGERRDVRSSKTSDPLDALASTDLVVLCNPNNPDGRVWIPDRLEAARAVLAERGGWLIVDDAYADVRPDLSMAMRGGRGGPHHFTLVR